jgi:hypothetical protein
MEKPIKYLRSEIFYKSYNDFKANINSDLIKVIEDGYIIHTYNEVEYLLNNQKQVKVVLLLVKYNEKQFI